MEIKINIKAENEEIDSTFESIEEAIEFLKTYENENT